MITARSDTMDSLMMALSVLAAWLVVRAIRAGAGALAVRAPALVAGLNFEVKLFEALAALPALVVLYALGAPSSFRRRALHIALAGGAFLVAALWWPVAVSLAGGAEAVPDRLDQRQRVERHVRLQRHRPRASPPARSRAHGTRPGRVRLFDANSFQYGGFIGIELLAALVLGALALVLLARAP